MSDQMTTILPADFSVYGEKNRLITQPGHQSRLVRLPTHNHYLGPDGGYIAVYTRETHDTIYSVGDGVNVVGQIRVPGTYCGRIFYPAGYTEGDDITQDAQLLELCAIYFPQLQGNVWVGGDTGGWFGA
jgi:hypothetical protein